MGRTGKWFKSLWAGKKDQSKNSTTTNRASINSSYHNQTKDQITPVIAHRPATPTKEKKRWSFRRSSATSATASPNKDPNAEAIHSPNTDPKAEATASPLPTAPPPPEPEEESALAVEAAADPVALVVQDDGGDNALGIEEAAAIKIQAVYRSYLARKALKALRGLVKLQALVRGHLVRKQATATLRCMQALVTAQARARADRIRSVEDGKMANHRSSTHMRNSQDKIKYPYHDMEDDIRIVEMDHGEYYNSSIKSRNNYTMSSHQQHMNDRVDDKISTYYSSQRVYTKQDYPNISPAPSAITDISPQTCSGHFEDYSFATAQSSPQCYSAMSNRPDPSTRAPLSFPRPDYAEPMSYDYPLYPNYMANTESSRAKARSQSAPKQRPEFERQPSRGRRASVDRGIPRGARMQRSSSHVSSTAQTIQYPWSIKLDKSTVSLVESEYGSNCSLLTNGNYCRSVVSYDVSS